MSNEEKTNGYMHISKITKEIEFVRKEMIDNINGDLYREYDKRIKLLEHERSLLEKSMNSNSDR